MYADSTPELPTEIWLIVFHYLDIIDQAMLSQTCRLFDAARKENFPLPPVLKPRSVAGNPNTYLANISIYNTTRERAFLEHWIDLLKLKFNFPIQQIRSDGTWNTQQIAPNLLVPAALLNMEPNKAKELYNLLTQLANLTDKNNIHTLLNTLYVALNQPDPNQNWVSIVNIHQNRETIGKQVNILGLLCLYFRHTLLAKKLYQEYKAYIENPKSWLDLAAELGSEDLCRAVLNLPAGTSLEGLPPSLTIVRQRDRFERYFDNGLLYFNMPTPPVQNSIPIAVRPDQTTLKKAIGSKNLNLVKLVLTHLETNQNNYLDEKDLIEWAFESNTLEIIKYIIQLLLQRIHNNLYFFQLLQATNSIEELKQIVWDEILRFSQQNNRQLGYFTLLHKKLTERGGGIRIDTGTLIRVGARANLSPGIPYFGFPY